MLNEEDFGALDPARENSPHVAAATFRIATTRYLNALPLTYGLERDPTVHLVQDNLHRIWNALAADQVDAALLPAFELQRGWASLVAVPAGCVACAGPSMTARVFCKIPPKRVGAVWADMRARTATALCRVLWACNYRRWLNIIPFDPVLQTPAPEADAVLLVEDDIVSSPPLGYDYQVDLGGLWFQTTGLPFVFAVWSAAADADCAKIHQLLTDSRLQGRQHLEQIAREQGAMRGWPEDLAVRYLTRQMNYEFTDAHRDGLEEFFFLCEAFGIIDQARPLHIYKP